MTLGVADATVSLVVAGASATVAVASLAGQADALDPRGVRVFKADQPRS